MSVICFNIENDRTSVVADGRVLYGHKIAREDEKKIKLIGDSIILGVTGLVDSKDVFFNYADLTYNTDDGVNEICDKTSALRFMNNFKDHLVTNFSYTNEESFSELGGFLILIKGLFHGVFFFDDKGKPYCTLDESECGAIGSAGDYVSALMDYGVTMEDAIKFAAKKDCSINDNLFKITI